MENKKPSNIFIRAYTTVIDFLGNITWGKIIAKYNKTGKYYKLTATDWEQISSYLSKDYFIIATRRDYSLSTYMIVFASWVRTFIPSYYDHVLLNVEQYDTTSKEQHWFEEATGKGVHYSKFEEVFDCDSIVLLKPKNVSQEHWNAIVLKASEQIGKPYDSAFQLEDDSRLSCVELILDALKALPDFEERFPHLSKEVKRIGNLTPQMFYVSPDFTVVLEIRR